MQPLLQRMDWAGLIPGSAADLDLAPAILGVQRQNCALFENLDSAAAVWCVVLVDVEANYFIAAQAPGVAHEQDRLVLNRQARVPTFDPGQHAARSRCDGSYDRASTGAARSFRPSQA